MQVEWSQSVAVAIGARPNCCYRNAMLALLQLPEGAAWRYVEGWVITHDWPLEHAWLQTPEGQIVDPTLALFGQRYRLARYFGGPSFNRSDLKVYSASEAEVLSAAEHIKPLVYRAMWGYSEYEEAKARAYADRSISRMHRLGVAESMEVTGDGVVVPVSSL